MVARETSLAAGLAHLGIPESVRVGAIPRLLAFADLLEREAIPRGFLGPNESARIVDRHLLGSAMLLRFLPESGTVVDVGSGAGLPAIVLASFSSARIIIALETQKRRASFIRSTARQIGVAVEVVADRAELVARSDLRDSAEVAIGRALADFPIALELTLPFVKVGGVAVLSSPSEGPRGFGSAGEAARELGGGDPEPLKLDIPGSEESLWLTIVGKERPTPDRYPRRAGVPGRRPLGR